MALTIQEIIEAAAQLTVAERQQLIQALTEGRPASQRSITELRGLGKEIWHCQDAQEYVNQERDSWEG